MAYELKYSANYAGAKALSLSDQAQITSGIYNRATVTNLQKGYYLILTGYGYYDGKYINYLQTTDGWYIVIDTYNNTQNYWQVTEGAFDIKTYSQSAAQSLIDQIINNNKVILSRNLLCARFSDKLSKEQKQTLYDLQSRLEARNSALQTDGLTDHVEKSYPAEYAELSAYLNKIMENGAIGVAVSTVIWIVVAATVVIGAGTACYYTYKHLADESEADLKYSKELTATLVSKLTPEEYQQLLDETKGLLTKSKIKQLVRTSINWLYVAALVGAGAFAYKFLRRQ